MTEDDDEAGPALEEAMDWLLRRQAAPGDPVVARDFEHWLGRSDSHRHAWEQARLTWQVMGAVPPVHERTWRRGTAARTIGIAPPESSPTPPARARRGRVRLAWGLGALAACLLLSFAYHPAMLRLRADHVTAVAERSLVELVDGTRVELGADSAIASDVSQSGRRVVLLAGEAFFDVAADAARPFTIDAAGVEIAVVGTAFNVRLSSTTASVEIDRGTVDVSYRENETHSTIRLSVGEMVVVDRATGAMAKSAIAPEDVGAWRSGRLFVKDAAIGSVVEQLRRYHPAWIGLADNALAAREVTGVYDLDHPDRALRALVQPHGGRVWDVSPYVRILTGG